MTYKRKTVDTWQLWVNYGQGWEHETTEHSLSEYRKRVIEYGQNCPEHPIKLVTKRELIEKLSRLDPNLPVFTEGKHKMVTAADAFLYKEPDITGHKKVCLITDNRYDSR